MTPMQFLMVYIAGAIVTTMFIGAFHTVKGGKLDVDHILLILPWPFTWLCLLIGLIFAIAYWFGGKMSEIIKDIID